MIRGSMPPMAQPFVQDDNTINLAWWLFLQSLHQRTGNAPGIDIPKELASITDTGNGLSYVDGIDVEAAIAALRASIKAIQSSVNNAIVLSYLNETPATVRPDPFAYMLV